MAEVRQHILITGASAGIGEALARILAPDARISALARRTDRLSSLSSEHEHITGYQADVASFDSAKQAVSRAVAESGPVDMLILNAGIYQPVSAEEFDAEIYRKHMDINYMGVINLLELVIKDMIAAKQDILSLWPLLPDIEVCRVLPPMVLRNLRFRICLNLYISI